MKRTRMSFGASLEFKPAHPERTARRSAGDWDIEFCEWNARGPMARAIRMQESRAPRQGDWRPCVPLTPGEGH